MPDPIQALDESLQQYPLCDRNQGLRRIHSACAVPPSGKCQCQSAQHQLATGATVMLVQRGSLSVMFFNSWLLSSHFGQKRPLLQNLYVEDPSLPPRLPQRKVCSSSHLSSRLVALQNVVDTYNHILKFPSKRIQLYMYNSALDQK